MSYYTIENLLGGAEGLGLTIRSEMDLYRLGREGIPKKALLSLAANINISLRALSDMLHIAERTLQRKHELEPLNETLSEHILQIAEVYSRGQEAFGGMEEFQAWIVTPNIALGRKKPVELLSSRYGAAMVLDEIGRIEHGVIS